MQRITDLPFSTFGEAAAFGLVVTVSCRCRREAVFDGRRPDLERRIIMGARFRCRTILDKDTPCNGTAVPVIQHGDRLDWIIARHRAALLARHPDAWRQTDDQGYRGMNARGEVAALYCASCLPPYTIRFVAFDEEPWSRYLDATFGHRFRCPGCRKVMAMHVHGDSGGMHNVGYEVDVTGGPKPDPIRKRRNRTWMKDSG